MGSVSGINSLLSSLSSSSSTSSSLDLSSLLQAATGAATPGIDVTSAVNAAIYAAQAPERQWQTEQSTISAKVAALTGIQSALTKLSTDLQDLNSVTGSLSSRTASSSQSAVTASATSAAAIGMHTISVQNLATTASWYSPAVASGTGLGTSALTITSNAGGVYTFPGDSNGGSLTGLAQAINASSAGVTASVIHDASGSRLSLVGSGSGSAADFSVSYGVSGASTWTSSTEPNASSLLDGGSFNIGDGTSTAVVTVMAGDTLATVADSINAAGLALSASVVTGSSGAYLQINPSAGASVSVSADPAFSFTRASTASNASLAVDGVPVSSPTNTVTGAISGITLNLTGTTTSGSPATLNVAADKSAIQSALSTFISDYNSALTSVNSQFSYSSSTGSQGALSADNNMRSLQSMLLGVAGYSAHSGSGGGAINTLADIGITMGNDGTLSIDSSKMNSALDDPSAVQSLFQGTSHNGFAQLFAAKVTGFSDSAVGSISKQIQNLNQQYSALGTQVTDYENGYIASQRTVLTAMYSKAEIALQQLPSEMKQIQAQLGNSSSGG